MATHLDAINTIKKQTNVNWSALIAAPKVVMASPCQSLNRSTIYG